MRKYVFLFIVFGLFVMLMHGVGAITINLEESYSPRETIIAEISGNILSPISGGQVNLIKLGHVPVPFEFDVGQILGKYYIWLVAPESEGNYTLVIEDVSTTIGGIPIVIDYENDFSVAGPLVDYSIKPGFVFSSEDFDITATLYEDFDKTINVDFPEPRRIILKPGTNKIGFSIEDVLGSHFVSIVVGRYAVPAHVIGQESICGDGSITGNEVCDGSNLGDITGCGEFGFNSGNLSCASDCLSFDNSSCELIEENSQGNNVNEDSTGENSIGENNGAREDIVNDGGSSESVLEMNPNLPISFRFNPSSIQGTILTSSFPVYPFEIVNLGEGPLVGLSLDYNRNRFSITPDKSISINSNESALFNLTMKNISEKGVRGVVIAYVGGKSENLFLSFGLTDNENDVSTIYSDDDEVTPIYYCSELSGKLCTGGEICSGEEVLSQDGGCCVTGQCEQKPNEGGGFIGYLIIGVIVLVLLIVYVKYKKTKQRGSPTAKRFSLAEKKLP